MPISLRTRMLLLAILLIQAAAVSASIGEVKVEFYPLAGSKTNPIVASYTGKLYSPPQPLLDASARKLDLPAEHLLRHMMNTIRRGTLTEFIALWETGDQLDVKRYYETQAGLWGKLQKHYNQIPDQRLVNLMHYGKYVLLQVLKLPPKLKPFVSTVVLKQTRNGLRLSNDLEGDAVHAYFATEFATRLVEEFIAAEKAKKR